MESDFSGLSFLASPSSAAPARKSLLLPGDAVPSWSGQYRANPVVKHAENDGQITVSNG